MVSSEYSGEVLVQLQLSKQSFKGTVILGLPTTISYFGLLSFWLSMYSYSMDIVAPYCTVVSIAIEGESIVALHAMQLLLNGPIESIPESRLKSCPLKCQPQLLLVAPLPAPSMMSIS